MTNEEMQKLRVGDVVKVQIDEDPELEEGVVLKVGTTRCLIPGIDPELGGYWKRVRASDIITVVSRSVPVSVIEEIKGLLP